MPTRFSEATFAFNICNIKVPAGSSISVCLHEKKSEGAVVEVKHDVSKADALPRVEDHTDREDGRSPLVHDVSEHIGIELSERFFLGNVVFRGFLWKTSQDSCEKNATVVEFFPVDQINDHKAKKDDKVTPGEDG